MGLSGYSVYEKKQIVNGDELAQSECSEEVQILKKDNELFCGIAEPSADLTRFGKPYTEEGTKAKIIQNYIESTLSLTYGSKKSVTTS